MISRLALAAALFISPSVAMAATVDVRLIGGVSVGTDGDGRPAFDGFDFLPLPFVSLSAGRTEEAQASGTFGSGSAQAEYSVDAVTGQLRFGVEVDVKAVEDGRGSASSLVQLSLQETYFLSGTGRVTVGMQLSADWNAQAYFLQAQTRPEAFSGEGALNSSHVRAVGVPGFANFDTNETGPGAGLVDRLLIETVLDVIAPEGGFLDFVWFMQGEVSVSGGRLPSESAFLDALNTANIFVRTSGNLTATPVTAGFLSQQVFVDPSPVPVPASGLLLMAGLAGLTALRRRKRIA